MSRIISNEFIKEAKSWRIPDVEHTFNYGEKSFSQGFGGICDQIPTLKDVEDMKKHAYDSGFKEGYEDGMQIAKEEFDKKSSAAQKIIETLNDISSHIDNEVKNELLELAVLIAKRVIQAEISIHPEKIHHALSAAVAVLPSVHSNFDIVINPQDARLVQEFLSNNTEKPGRSWNIVEDEDITRGGCKILSNNSCVDASIETRISKAIASIIPVAADME